MSVERKINRNVYLLGFLSFFNDIASDMIVPLLPVYLGSMGLGATFLGLMEGCANSLSNITMLFSGWYTDRHGNHQKVTTFGYRFCAFLRPLLSIPVPALILTTRLLDRIGKGIRTSPRDQIITASSSKDAWGKAFGIHRSMDHLGALLGPPLASWLLISFSLSLPQVFLIAAFPAILAVLVIPKKLKTTSIPPLKKETSFIPPWKTLPLSLKRYTLITFLGALSTPSELFIILKIKEMGMPVPQIPFVWFVLTFFTLLASYCGGFLADFWSRRRTIAVGWFLFTLSYTGFALIQNLRWAWILVALHGFQTGIVESSERAYPVRVVPDSLRATALGWFSFSYGLGLLPASFLFGILWKTVGTQPAFLINAGLTLISIPLLLIFVPSDRQKTSR